MIACVEVGGSGTQTVVFGPGAAAPRYFDGVFTAGCDVAAIAIPGIIAGSRVVAASNLRWFDVDPAERLGIACEVAVVLNDAEAAGLGEAALRNVDDLTYVGMGTGVGGAVITAGKIVAGNLFGHARRFSNRQCACGSVGCLETVAAGWALPHPLAAQEVVAAAAATAHAIDDEAVATTSLVVIGGGLARAYPALVEGVAATLVMRSVEASAAPAAAKSAAAWGLRRAVLTIGEPSA